MILATHAPVFANLRFQHTNEGSSRRHPCLPKKMATPAVEPQRSSCIGDGKPLEYRTWWRRGGIPPTGQSVNGAERDACGRALFSFPLRVGHTGDQPVRRTET